MPTKKSGITNEIKPLFYFALEIFTKITGNTILFLALIKREGAGMALSSGTGESEDLKVIKFKSAACFFSVCGFSSKCRQIFPIW